MDQKRIRRRRKDNSKNRKEKKMRDVSEKYHSSKKYLLLVGENPVEEREKILSK
jgi:hypothetical protein